MLALTTVVAGLISLLIAVGLLRKSAATLGGNGIPGALDGDRVDSRHLKGIFLSAGVALALWGLFGGFSAFAFCAGALSVFVLDRVSVSRFFLAAAYSRTGSGPALGFFTAGASLLVMGVLYFWLGWADTVWNLSAWLLGSGLYAGLRFSEPKIEGRAREHGESGPELAALFLVYSVGLVSVTVCASRLSAPNENLKLWYMASGAGIAVVGIVASLVGVRAMEYLRDGSLVEVRRKSLAVGLGTFLIVSFLYSIISPGYSLWCWLGTSIAAVVGLFAAETSSWMSSRFGKLSGASALLGGVGGAMLTSAALAEGSEKLFAVCLAAHSLCSLFPLFSAVGGVRSACPEYTIFPNHELKKLVTLASAVALVCALGQADFATAAPIPGGQSTELLLWGIVGLGLASLPGAIFQGAMAIKSQGVLEIWLLWGGLVFAIAIACLGGPLARGGVVSGVLGLSLMWLWIDPGDKFPASLIIFSKLLCICSLFIALIAGGKG